MKVLITGGFGYIGGRLAQHLATRSHHEIILGSRSTCGAPAWLPGAKVVRTQWNSPNGLEQICADVDAIVHLAGMNALECAADPAAALEFNAVATARLLQAAIRRGVNRFVYVSTAHVYGNILTGVITEETCPASLHPYASSHRAAEDVVRGAHQRGEIAGVVARLSNAFGAPAHERAKCWMLLLNDLFRQAVTTGRMEMRSSGQQRRDFITLTDACRALAHLLKLAPEELGDGVFNIGGEQNLSILELSLALRERASKRLNADVRLARPPDAIAEQVLPLRYCTDKIARTGFALNGDQTAELDLLLEFCIACFGHATREDGL